jgi:hypothetical protein
MLWVLNYLVITISTIQADASSEEKPHFQVKLDCLVVKMRLRTMERVPFHYQQAQVLKKAVFRTADGLREHHPEIN